MERYYMIFNVSELANINFNEVLETSAETVRKSVNKEKTFVKWEGITPSCVENLQTKEGKYDYDQMVAILNTEEWSPNILILP